MKTSWIIASIGLMWLLDAGAQAPATNEIPAARRYYSKRVNFSAPQASMPEEEKTGSRPGPLEGLGKRETSASAPMPMNMGFMPFTMNGPLVIPDKQKKKKDDNWLVIGEDAKKSEENTESGWGWLADNMRDEAQSREAAGQEEEILEEEAEGAQENRSVVQAQERQEKTQAGMELIAFTPVGTQGGGHEDKNSRSSAPEPNRGDATADAQAHSVAGPLQTKGEIHTPSAAPAFNMDRVWGQNTVLPQRSAQVAELKQTKMILSQSAPGQTPNLGTMGGAYPAPRKIDLPAQAPSALNSPLRGESFERTALPSLSESKPALSTRTFGESSTTLKSSLSSSYGAAEPRLAPSLSPSSVGLTRPANESPWRASWQ